MVGTIVHQLTDGAYFSKAINLLDYILNNPKLLDKPANQIITEKENFKY